MATYSAKPHEVRHQWLLLDANGQTLGRLAAKIAALLRGKHKAEFTPHVDTGDYIVVVNAEKLRVTGKKSTQKLYRHHTGYPGGVRSIEFNKLQAKHPTRILEFAVKGMLPKNSLGRAMFRKLKVYVGSQHQHMAQQPQSIEL